jgi:hypothetical protein
MEISVLGDFTKEMGDDVDALHVKLANIKST